MGCFPLLCVEAAAFPCTGYKVGISGDREELSSGGLLHSGAWNEFIEEGQILPSRITLEVVVPSREKPISLQGW